MAKNTKAIPKISDSQWQVMRVLWSKGKATANEIVAGLPESTSWKPRTVKTLINRLLQKKAIGFEKNAKEYLYFSLISEKDCAGAENRSFIQRVYGGAIKPMLAAFLEEENLSPEDIKELKRILGEKEGK
jgi:BlaI family transcriptional regulator, penicillinase repressor